MANEMTFQLDLAAAQTILTDMSSEVVRQSADAIAGRAESIATSMTSQPVSVTVSQGIGVIRRGKRSIARVDAKGVNAHTNYLAHKALAKSKDAGRL